MAVLICCSIGLSAGGQVRRCYLMAIDEKVSDEEHREILGMLSNIHHLELQLAGREQESKYLNTILEEQEGWCRAQLSYNTQLLQIVRTQHQLLNGCNVQITPELLTLYRNVEERSISEYSALPRIGSAISSVAEDTRSVDSTPPPTPPPDSTPIFMKTYNVVDKEEGGVERDMSQTTIHVLSTPSLTGDNSPQSPSLSSLTIPTKGSSSSDLLTPINTAQSSQIPGKQAKKAIQLQRLRTLRTEPGMKQQIKPKKQPRGTKNLNTRTFNKNPQIKSETNIRMAEKARIYGGGDARTPLGKNSKRGKKQGGSTSQIQLSISGTNKNFPGKVFR